MQSLTLNYLCIPQSVVLLYNLIAVTLQQISLKSRSRLTPQRVGSCLEAGSCDARYPGMQGEGSPGSLRYRVHKRGHCWCVSSHPSSTATLCHGSQRRLGIRLTALCGYNRAIRSVMQCSRGVSKFKAFGRHVPVPTSCRTIERDCMEPRCSVRAAAIPGRVTPCQGAARRF